MYRYSGGIKPGAKNTEGKELYACFEKGFTQQDLYGYEPNFKKQEINLLDLFSEFISSVFVGWRQFQLIQRLKIGCFKNGKAGINKLKKAFFMSF